MGDSLSTDLGGNSGSSVKLGHHSWSKSNQRARYAPSIIIGGTNSVQQDPGVEEEMTVEDARDDSPAN